MLPQAAITFMLYLNEKKGTMWSILTCERCLRDATVTKKNSTKRERKINKINHFIASRSNASNVRRQGPSEKNINHENKQQKRQNKD